MGDRISSIDPLKDKRWGDFVQKHPMGSVHHHPAWFNLITSTFNYLPRCYALINDETGCLKGVFPFMTSSSVLKGGRLLSLPYATYCDPLIPNERIVETLEHVADPIAFLNELHRISTETTIMVLSCPPATSEVPYQVYTYLFGGHGEGPHRFPSTREVKQMFEKTGWKLIQHKPTMLVPVGPKRLKSIGERLIDYTRIKFIKELGIRQFYVCEKY